MSVKAEPVLRWVRRRLTSMACTACGKSRPSYLQAADLAAAVPDPGAAGLRQDLLPGQAPQWLAQFLLIPLHDQEVVAVGGDNVLGVGALSVHRIGGDDDAAQLDPVQQRGECRDFVALRGNLTLSDHGLAGVQRGGEQVDGFAVGT